MRAESGDVKTASSLAVILGAYFASLGVFIAVRPSAMEAAHRTWATAQLAPVFGASHAGLSLQGTFQ
ncbi:MAG: hypothetical protein JNL79_25925 [Myxococcales bacterium]|nr:hypothetical protein [Myxococcales bacterium]